MEDEIFCIVKYNIKIIIMSCNISDRVNLKTSSYETFLDLREALNVK
jgi:hypothetical protein